MGVEDQCAVLSTLVFPLLSTVQTHVHPANSFHDVLHIKSKTEEYRAKPIQSSRKTRQNNEDGIADPLIIKNVTSVPERVDHHIEKETRLAVDYMSRGLEAPRPSYSRSGLESIRDTLPLHSIKSSNQGTTNTTSTSLLLNQVRSKLGSKTEMALGSDEDPPSKLSLKLQKKEAAPNNIPIGDNCAIEVPLRTFKSKKLRSDEEYIEQETLENIPLLFTFLSPFLPISFLLFSLIAFLYC